MGPDLVTCSRMTGLAYCHMSLRCDWRLGQLRLGDWIGTLWIIIVLAAGPLPGLHQTAFRAELYYVAVALEWASTQACEMRIWV